jgi:hypothetical protein
VTPYEPPQGMADLVRIVQAVSPSRAADLLALAFQECAHDAVTDYLRVQYAAPVLLAACKAALATAETGRALNWDALSAAVDQAERTEAPVA